ncbi:ATP-binding protein [Streptomyces canus]|uniref:ATP-binding protein n=1 Tax=Streptomyces canus TaxID=58343 RepID=UPI003F6B8C28
MEGQLVQQAAQRDDRAEGDQAPLAFEAVVDQGGEVGAPGAHVELRCTTDGPHTVLTVTDDVPGLTPDEIQQATTRFWWSTRQNGTSGPGLGLAIAEQLLAGRGGRLELTPAHPQGLKARAVLPSGGAR